MKKIKQYLRVYRLRFKLALKIQSHSLANFYIGIFAFLVIQFSSILFLNIIFENVVNLEGFSFYQMIALYGFSQLTRGLDHFYSDYLWVFATRGYIRGEFDKYLTRPISPLFQIMIERIQFDALAEFLIGLLLVFYSLVNLNIPITLITLLQILFFTIVGSTTYTCLKIIGTASAFWIKNGFPVVKSLYSFGDFAKYPMTIYPQLLQTLLTFVLAYALTAYIPVQAIFMNGFTMELIIKTLTIWLSLILISTLIWKRGTNRYEGSGN